MLKFCFACVVLLLIVVVVVDVVDVVDVVSLRCCVGVLFVVFISTHSSLYVLCELMWLVNVVWLWHG